MIKSCLQITGLSFLFMSSLFAQVDINGSVDFEMTYAGQNSSFITNEVVQEFRRPHLGINQLNLFLFSQIDDDFFFNGRLQWDTWGTGKLNPVKLTLAALTWEPQDLPLSMSIGRFVSPFGLYPRRQLASENLFVNAPLAYGYFVNISDTRGFWAKAGNNGNYGTNDVGLTTAYFGGYTTGGMLNWVIAPELLDISVAVSNATPASQQNFTNIQSLAITSRLGFQPLIYWQQGISISYGSFMRRDAVNAGFDRLEKFRQLLVGTDFILADAYFELSGEFIYSKWTVPAIDGFGFQINEGGLLHFEATNYSGYMDLKFEPPFFTGSYIALRVEKLFFADIKKPASSTLSTAGGWDNNLLRYSAAVGYKISRSILLKFAFSEQVFDDPALKAEDYTFRTILTVSM